MPIRIHWNICDNADACGGIEVCPTGAIYWDEKANQIGVNDDRCSDCAACVDACPVGAIRFSPKADLEGLRRIEKEIKEDARTLEELEVERYGASLIDREILLDENDVEKTIKSTKGVLLIEFNKDTEINCLLHSIPVSEIKREVGQCSYRKVMLQNDIAGIEKFPSLLVVVDGARNGIVEGYYEDDETDVFLQKIRELLK